MMVERGTARDPIGWAVLHAFTLLLGVLTLLTLLSLRSVWPLINRYIADAIPLGQYTFSTILAAFFGILASSAVLFAYRLTAQGWRNPRCSLGMTGCLLFKVAVYGGLLTVLYLNMKSLYFELLPLKLLQNGVLITSIAAAVVEVARRYNVLRRVRNRALRHDW